MPDAVFKDLCLDTNRPDDVAPFWATALGLTAHRQDGGDYQLKGATPSETVWVNTVADDLGTKSRVHLDVRFPAGPPDGVTVVQEHEHWTVAQDPDGLELC